MIPQIFLQKAGEAIAKAAVAAGQAIVRHIAKHGTKYVIGGGMAAAAGGAYEIGQAKGHKKGKKEGVAEQAARDEEKMREMHENHESDRRRWKESQEGYEHLLDEIQNK